LITPCIYIGSSAATGILEQTLIERFGADIRLPDLREELAQCELRGKKTHDAYMVRYVDVIPR
jgi:hypothetical protein